MVHKKRDTTIITDFSTKNTILMKKLPLIHFSSQFLELSLQDQLAIHLFWCIQIVPMEINTSYEFLFYSIDKTV